MSTIIKTYKGTLDDGEFPAIVYKYRDWNAEHHNRFITEREIFMAFPNSFKDELDCKLPMRYDLLTPKQLMTWSMKMSKIKNPHFNRNQHRKECRSWLKEKKFYNKEFLQNYHNHYNIEHNKRRGVLSLTAEPCLTDMWNRYANNSKGFCIGYNSRIMFEYLGGGGKVAYYDELPIILPDPIMDSIEIHFLQIYSKEKKWEFEQEYRTHMFWADPADMAKRQIKLPIEAFNKVILGNNITDSNRKEIIAAVKNNIGDIPIIEQLELCL